MAGQFVLEVMHEVRNPLDALGNLVYLAADARELGLVNDYMNAAKEQIVSLNQIANQTLTLARNAQTATLVDMLGIVEAAIRVHQRRIDSKQVHLVRDMCEEANLSVRKGEILQAVSNLIGNGLVARPRRGPIPFAVKRGL